MGVDVVTTPPPAPGTMLQLLLPNQPHPTVTELVDECGWAFLVDTAQLPLAQYPEGSRFAVEWVTERGRHQIPVRLDLRSDDDRRWCFLVSTADATTVDQRRFPRGGGGELGTLRRTPQVPGVELTVVDMSECSVRAAVDRSRAARVGAGERYNLQLSLGDRSVNLVGTVLRVQDHGHPHQVDVVLLFQPDVAQAELLRTYIAQHSSGQTVDISGEPPITALSTSGWLKRL